MADAPERSEHLPHLAQAAWDGFVGRFGGAPDGVWSAPGRVNLIGEHTDYNGGLALPIALPQRTYAAAARADDGTLTVTSETLGGEPVRVALDEVGPGRPSGWAGYVAGVIWALRHDPSLRSAAQGLTGLRVHVVSEVPLGAGLSSSAALECAVGAALSDLLGLDLLADDAGRAALARLGQTAENEVVGAPTGGMDQAASARCTRGHAILLDCRDGSLEQVPVDLEGSGQVLLVIDTRAEHSHADGEYGDRRRTCEAAAALLGVSTLREIDPGELDATLARLDDEQQQRRVRHVVTEIERVRACVAALEAGDLAQVGRLFTASHASLRDDYEVSCAELDVAVDAALAAGALGARMTGGGFGGSAIALVPDDAADSVTDAVLRAFAERGLATPEIFTATAAGPAARDA